MLNNMLCDMFLFYNNVYVNIPSQIIRLYICHILYFILKMNKKEMPSIFTIDHRIIE